jgi:hypothetical protein
MGPIKIMGKERQPWGARRLRDMGMSRPGPKVLEKYLLPPEEAIFMVSIHLKLTLALCVACRGYSAAEEAIYQSGIPRDAAMDALGELLRCMIMDYGSLKPPDAVALSCVRDAAAYFGFERERKSAVSKMAGARGLSLVKGDKGKAEK